MKRQRFNAGHRDHTYNYQCVQFSVVANYMMWQVVQSYIGELSDDFKKILLDYKKAKTGTMEEEPQWQQCLRSTSGAFGMPLGLLYINEKFSGGNKAKVRMFFIGTYGTKTPDG